MKKYNTQNLLIYLWSFLLPTTILSLIFVLWKVYPLGKHTILTTDLWHQYIHFYYYFYDAVTGENSLLYSWNAGLGTNFIGNVAYYTSSPFLFILFFFKKKFLVEAVMVLIILKLGLAGFSISYFIKRKFPKLKSLEIVLFSAFYALMSYSIVYYYNIMWLDGLIWLPLLILSIDSLIFKKKTSQFIFLLSVMFISNFYIAYMIGLFIFLYFITGIIQYRKSLTRKELIVIISRFVGGTIVAAGVSAILTLPTYFQLLGTESQSSTELGSSFNILYMLFKTFSGTYDSVMEKTATPSLYIGTLVWFLVPSFFINRKINKSDKFRWGVLLIVLLISMEVPALSILWHAGDIPNSFPYRFSFLFSFIVYFISLKGYEYLDTIKKRQVAIMYLVAVVFILINTIYLNNLRMNHFWNIVFISMFGLFIYLRNTSNYKKLAYFILIIYTVGELSYNTGAIFLKLTEELGGIFREEFSEYQDYIDIVDKVKENDSDLYYRIDTDLNNTYNDSLHVGYSGFSYFSSMVSYDLSQTLKALGFPVKKARYYKDGGTLFTEALLGQKYMVSSKEINKFGYDEVLSQGDLAAYRNYYALPIGFMVNEEMTTLKVSDSLTPFELQNEVFRRLTNKEKESLYQSISPIKVEFINGIEVFNGEAKQLIRQDKNFPINIRYKFYIENESELYTLLSTSVKENHSRIIINQQKIAEYPNYINDDSIQDLGKFDKQDITVELMIDEDVVDFYKELFYQANINKLKSIREGIDDHALRINSLKGNELIANINVKQEPGLLFLSIPWDEGWNIQVDQNQKIKPIKVLNAFMAIPIDEGMHQIKLTFTPQGFKIGRIISILSFIIFLLVLGSEKGANRRKEKKEGE